MKEFIKPARPKIIFTLIGAYCYITVLAMSMMKPSPFCIPNPSDNTPPDLQTAWEIAHTDCQSSSFLVQFFRLSIPVSEFLIFVLIIYLIACILTHFVGKQKKLKKHW